MYKYINIQLFTKYCTQGKCDTQHTRVCVLCTVNVALMADISLAVNN